MRTTAVAAISIALFSITMADTAQARIKKVTNIPESPLGSALRMLAKDRKLQVLFRSHLVRDLRTAGAVGELTTNEALTKILSGTALTFQYLDERTITVVPMSASNSAAVDARPALRLAQGEIQQSTESMQKMESTESGKLLHAPLSSDSAESQDLNSKSIQTITVVGSSIRAAQDPLTSARPIQTITAEQFQRSSAEHIGEYVRKYSLNSGHRRD